LTEDSREGTSPQPGIAQALKDGREIQDSGATLRRKDSQPIPVRFSMVPLRDQNKVVGGVITVRLDRTDKHPTG
jgi:hypothetical protein